LEAKNNKRETKKMEGKDSSGQIGGKNFKRKHKRSQGNRLGRSATTGAVNGGESPGSTAGRGVGRSALRRRLAASIAALWAGRRCGSTSLPLRGGPAATAMTNDTAAATAARRLEPAMEELTCAADQRRRDGSCSTTANAAGGSYARS